MKIELEKIATFGVAGNFTGHLEQAGEAKDFLNVKTEDVSAPKGIFPTYLPEIKEDFSNETKEKVCPDFLHLFPFDENKIIFPENEENIQIEPECALLFEAQWEKIKSPEITSKLKSLKAISFFASNDCSIRKEGAKKISQKKNWGPSSKGYGISSSIKIDSFCEKGIINNYNIVSFILRDNKLIQYGEDSSIKDYSYIYEKLTNWIIDKINNQQNQGPLEDLHKYLEESAFPKEIVISIGATRYTEFGEKNYLKRGDKAIIVLYPFNKYSREEIKKIILENLSIPDDISLLSQKIV